MLVSRSSLEKPSPLDKLVRMTSPSRISSLVIPLCLSSCAIECANVVLPAAGSPVNHTVNPFAFIPFRSVSEPDFAEFSSSHSYGQRIYPTPGGAQEKRLRIHCGHYLKAVGSD